MCTCVRKPEVGVRVCMYEVRMISGILLSSSAPYFFNVFKHVLITHNGLHCEQAFFFFPRYFCLFKSLFMFMVLLPVCLSVYL